jgi:WD40 repeat protein
LALSSGDRSLSVALPSGALVRVDSQGKPTIRWPSLSLSGRPVVTAFSSNPELIAEADGGVVRIWPASAAAEKYDLLPVSSGISADLNSFSQHGGRTSIKTRRGDTAALPSADKTRWAGKYLVSTTGPFWIYDPDSKKVWAPKVLGAHPPRMSVSGDRFAVVSGGCSVWRFLRDAPLLRRDNCSAVALSPESGGAAIERQSVDLYSEAAGGWSKMGEIRLQDPVHRVVYSPRGDRMVVMDGSRSVRLYESSGAFQATFWHPQGAALYAAWSPDGKFVLTADSVGRMLMWNLESERTVPSGDPLLDLLPHPGPVEEALFSGDQNRLAVFTQGWITLYDLEASGPQFHAARPLDGAYVAGRFLDSASELEIGVELTPNQQAIQKMQWAGSANPPRLTFDQWATKCGLKVNIAGQFEPIHSPNRFGSVAVAASGSTGGGF